MARDIFGKGRNQYVTYKGKKYYVNNDILCLDGMDTLDGDENIENITKIQGLLDLTQLKGLNLSYNKIKEIKRYKNGIRN